MDGDNDRLLADSDPDPMLSSKSSPSVPLQSWPSSSSASEPSGEDIDASPSPGSLMGRDSVTDVAAADGWNPRVTRLARGFIGLWSHRPRPRDSPTASSSRASLDRDPTDPMVLGLEFDE